MQQSNPQAQPDTSPIPDFSKAAKHYERSAPGAAECLSVEDLCLFYGQHQALFNVNMSIREKREIKNFRTNSIRIFRIVNY